MKKIGFEPAESTYTALFNACANSPFPNDGLLRAKNLREQLCNKNFQFNQQHYHVMIKGKDFKMMHLYVLSNIPWDMF